ncbi:MAG: CtsR family transcriptional regulator [bacterium]|nr:CtsR family transcriptional regulator [bacterium]MDD6225150.1 CtsR family transcriptional regulator [bacterium]MDY3861771.1 CtsR family transcriptional regulator [Ruminococcus sp.]
MRMSDLVAQYIMEMLDESGGNAEIQRNELAGNLGCVPSQINYVITSRFTPEQGYIVESRRGGGGYIRITRVKADKSTALMHIINSIGSSLDKASAEIMVKNMYSQSIIDKQVAKLLLSAMNERVYADIPQEQRNTLRANIMKNMLLSLYN